MAPPDWQPWQTATFLDAQRRRRPVLLLLEAAWSPATADAHARVFARPDVAAVIAEATVPVRIDVDRRPDIADRYGLGQWPSVLLLTPEGLVLTGGTRLDEGLAARIRAAADAFAASPPSVPAAPAPTAAEAITADPWALLASLETHLDANGADAAPRLPASAQVAQAVLCAFAQAAAARDPHWAAVAAAGLDAVADPPPPDDEADGPVAPRRLEDEAEMVRVLARAVHLEPFPEWQARLDRRLASLLAFLRPDGHWRPWAGSPRLVLVDASARACRALLAVAVARDDVDLARQAIEALEVVAPVAYARSAGVSHVIDDGRAHGPLLLDDAMLLAHAALDADAWRGEPVYRDLAEELLQTALTRLAHPSGGLVDRVAALAGAGQVGRLAEAHLPLAGNAEAARLLRRLHPDDVDAHERARRILTAMHAEAREAGLFAAPVGLAWIGLDAAGATTAAW